MNVLDFLVGLTVKSIEHREHDWVVAFETDAYLGVECLWRLLVNGRISVTSEDDMQQFGLKQPIDAAAEVSRRVAGKKVLTVDVAEGTLDVSLVLEGGHTFQALPDSSGYEAWEASTDGKRVIAVGGGEVTVFR